MKTKILFLLVVLSSIGLCQNYEPFHHKFKFGSDTIFLSADLPYFKQNNILLGWHWGGEKKISHSERANQFDSPRNWANAQININSIDSNCNIILKPDGYSHAVGGELLNARGIQYEPTLEMNANVPDSLIIRQGDTTRPVFGFLNKRGRIITDPSNANFNRLIIDSNSLIDSVILSEPWPCNQLSSKGATGFGQSDETIDTFLCRFLYFSINLRRSDFAMNDSSVLKIEMPYSYLYDSTYLVPGDTKLHHTSVLRYSTIRFDSIPCKAPDSTYQISQSRGRARKDTIAPDETRAFYITKSMLPSDGSDITISAFFRCDGVIGPIPPDNRGNHLLKEYAPIDGRIDSLKIKITYLGGSPLMIDWVRIETPHTQRYLRGEFDQKIIDSIQVDLNKYTNDSFSTRGIRMLRYNTIIEGGLNNWIAERYFNKLIGNISTSEVDVIYPAHYEYYVNPPDRWLGTYKIMSNVSVPYSRKVYEPTTKNGLHTMNLINGYNGIDSGSTETNPTKSHYETYLINMGNPVDLNYFLNNPDSLLLYEQVMNTGNNYAKGSFLADYEGSIYRNYFKKSSRGFLFSDKFWWNQGFIHLEWKNAIDTIPLDNGKLTLGVLGKRPFTGEEFRLYASQGIMAGAKGLFYDGCETGATDYEKMQIYDFQWINQTVRDTIESENYPDRLFLSREISGSDFIRETNEIQDLNQRLYNLDSLAKYLDRPRDRLYVGRKSVRLEMRKLHDWICANDTTLMKLRLAGWLAKGFREWYIQDDKRFGNDTVFKRFINIDHNSIKTRPIDRQQWIVDIRHFMGGYYQPYYEPWDSSFVDITILRDSSDHNLIGNTWYLGVQNRHTSPLILTSDTLPNNGGIDNSLKFYSTAEFDQLARYGGNTYTGVFHDSTWWRQMYWKRSGAREVTINFDYKQSALEEYCLLRVRELGTGTSLDTDTNTWWFREPYRNRIDTIIGQNRSIAIKFLPGEGKMLKVDVLRPGKAEGFLAHSNQSKLIEYPTNANGDSIRYHMVFFKPQPGTNRNRVSYRRSKPFKKDDLNENIVWEREYLLSDTVIKTNLVGSDSLHCDYPSIVLRKSSDTLKAYIVYSCDDRGVSWDNTKSLIVENVLRFTNDDFFNKGDTIGRAIAQYYGIDRKEWGNPVVNASIGNYYAWSDSLSNNSNSQIVTAWKGSSSLYFLPQDMESINYTDWFGNYLHSYKHPSLNVYSNISKDENNCALVFQGNLTINAFWGTGYSGTSQIFYTRLKRLNSGMTHYIPTEFNPYLMKLDTQNRIAGITDSIFSNNNTYPVVIRNLADYRFISTGLPNRKDRIYWQTRSGNDSVGRDFLALRAINLTDSSNMPKRWGISPIVKIFKSINWLKEPNVNSGYTIDNNGSVVGEELILGFTASSINQQPSHISNIWQYPHSINSMLTNTDVLFNKPIAQRMGIGKQSHLSLNSIQSSINRIWKNRRVYEYDSTSPPEIMSSARFFYKMISENEEEGDALVGFTNDTTRYYINLPLLNGINLPIHLPYIARYDSTYDVFYEQVETDTLYSDWFSVGDEAQLEFKCYGYDTSRVAMKIHQQNTATYTNLTLPPYTTDSTGVLRQFTLYNGLGMNYRLEFTKRDTTAHYSEQIILDGLPVPDTMRKSTAMFGIPVDLQGHSYHNQGNKLKLSVFPNPTDDNIYATVYLPIEMIKSSSGLILKVFSTLGFELFRQEVKSGETLSIDTRSYPPGAYFIRADEKIDSFDKLPAVIQGFVIQR